MSQNAGSRSIRTTTPRNIYETLQNNPLRGAAVLDATYSVDGKNTGYVGEHREGTIIARITSNSLGAACKNSYTNGQGLAATAVVVDDARAFKAGDTVSLKSKNDVFVVGDLDAAAATGVAVYVHVDELDETHIAHLESVTAGNADCFWQSVSGAKIRVEDDDAAATAGVLLYFDEDAANPDERFLANLPAAKDAFLLSSDGRMIRIKYDASPGTAGVQVYCDDDGSSAVTNRMYFVSPTNVSGVQRTDDTVIGTGLENSLVTLASGLTINSIVYGTNTITVDTAATWADESFLVASGALAGLELARGILDEVVDLWDDSSRDVIDKSCTFVNGDARIRTAGILGDYVACRAYPGNFLDKLEFYTSGVRIQ